MTSEPSTKVDDVTPVVAPVKRRGRIMGLDGPRGLACLSVLILHVSAHYSPKTMATYKLQLTGQALILFFALSGFLLFLPYVKAILAEPGVGKLPDTKTFALHRVMRVFPGYLAVFLICSFVLRAVYLENASIQPAGTDRGTGMMTNPAELLANLTLVQSYIPQYFQTGINPSWSLTLELVFYATLPLIGVLTLKLRRRTSISPILLASIGPVVLLLIGIGGKLVSPVLQRHYGIHGTVLVEWGPNWVAVFNRSFISMADSFTFGMLAAILFVAISTDLVTGHFARRLRWYCGGAMVPVSVAAVVLLALNTHYSNIAVSLLAGLLVMFIIAPFARGEESAFARGLDWAPFKYVGEISLSVYLWHFPVLLVLGRWGLMAGDSVGGLLRNIALVVVVTVAAATLSYRYVERPALNLAKRYKAKPRAAAA